MVRWNPTKQRWTPKQLSSRLQQQTSPLLVSLSHSSEHEDDQPPSRPPHKKRKVEESKAKKRRSSIPNQPRPVTSEQPSRPQQQQTSSSPVSLSHGSNHKDSQPPSYSLHVKRTGEESKAKKRRSIPPNQPRPATSEPSSWPQQQQQTSSPSVSLSHGSNHKDSQPPSCPPHGKRTGEESSKTPMMQTPLPAVETPIPPAAPPPAYIHPATADFATPQRTHSI